MAAIAKGRTALPKSIPDTHVTMTTDSIGNPQKSSFSTSYGTEEEEKEDGMREMKVVQAIVLKREM